MKLQLTGSTARGLIQMGLDLLPHLKRRLGDEFCPSLSSRPQKGEKTVHYRVSPKRAEQQILAVIQLKV